MSRWVGGRLVWLVGSVADLRLLVNFGGLRLRFSLLVLSFGSLFRPSSTDRRRNCDGTLWLVALVFSLSLARKKKRLCCVCCEKWQAGAKFPYSFP